MVSSFLASGSIAAGDSRKQAVLIDDLASDARTLSAFCSSLMAASSCLCAWSSSFAVILCSFFISFSTALRDDMLG